MMPGMAEDLTLVAGTLLLPRWTLAAVDSTPGLLRLTCRDDAQRSVIFRVTLATPRTPRGPFDAAGLSIAYQPGEVPYADLEPLGKALAQRLATVGPGLLTQVAQKLAGLQADPTPWPLRMVPGEDRLELAKALDPRVVRRVTLAAGLQTDRDQLTAVREVLQAQGIAVETSGSALQPSAQPPSAPREAPADWRATLRHRLLDQPGKSMTLGELLGPQLPAWPCALPWTRLETSQGGFVGPCCLEYQDGRWPLDATPTQLWNGPALQAFRLAMTREGHPGTCRTTCPVLAGGTESVADVRLGGGPAAAIESQIRVVEDLLAGQTVMRGAPLSVCLTVTSYCNYDCLMCPHGEEGRLDDQLTPAFYDDLRALLPGVLVLEANGGEPLASPYFRAFLEGLEGRELPHLRVNLITNGSYLGPKQLDRFANVPWGNLTFSLNAATADTYLRVNRGLAYAKVRSHLDDLLARRRTGRLRADVTYSLVILKQNLHEIEAFADLARTDDVVVRYMLPFRDRHGSSILTDRGCMLEALRALQSVAARLLERGRGKEARGVLASARVLLQRLDARVVAAL